MLLIGVTACGCTSREELPRSTDFSSTTLGAPFNTIEPGVVPMSADEFVAALDAAITAQNFCQVARTLENVRPTGREDLTTIYQTWARRLPSIAPFVPSEIERSWKVVADVIVELDGYTANGTEPLTDDLVQSRMSTTNTDAAAVAVFYWAADHCPIDSAGNVTQPTS